MAITAGCMPSLSGWILADFGWHREAHAAQLQQRSGRWRCRFALLPTDLLPSPTSTMAMGRWWGRPVGLNIGSVPRHHAGPICCPPWGTRLPAGGLHVLPKLRVYGTAGQAAAQSRARLLSRRSPVLEAAPAQDLFLLSLSPSSSAQPPRRGACP